MNIGIVGLGHLGKIHLKLLSESDIFSIAALYDINSSLTDELGDLYNSKATSNFEELLELCDAVCIVTPTPTHFELASLAIKKGKHVFIEKPATDDLGDLKKLIKLQQEANVKVQIGHVERFNPAFTAAKSHILNPFLFEAKRLANYNERGTDVSVVLDLMIHDIDLILSIVKSKIKRISAVGTCIISKTADFVNAHIEFENGCFANLTANRISVKNTRTLDVFEKNTSIEIDLLAKTAKINSINMVCDEKNISQKTSEKIKITENQIDVIQINAIKEELNSFFNSIKNNTITAVSLVDAEKALLVAKEIEQQLKS